MNTREIAAEYRLSHWTQIMRDRGQSGLNIRAYCKMAGIHENVYYYWQKRLREAACEKLGGSGFAEVRLATSGVHLASVDTEQPGALRIEAGGVQITVDSAYPAEKLSVVLRALAKP